MEKETGTRAERGNGQNYILTNLSHASKQPFFLRCRRILREAPIILPASLRQGRTWKTASKKAFTANSFLFALRAKSLRRKCILRLSLPAHSNQVQCPLKTLEVLNAVPSLGSQQLPSPVFDRLEHEPEISGSSSCMKEDTVT